MAQGVKQKSRQISLTGWLSQCVAPLLGELAR